MNTMKFRTTLIALMIANKGWLTETEYVAGMQKASTAHPVKEGEPADIAWLTKLERDECAERSAIWHNTNAILMDVRAPQMFRLWFVQSDADLTNFEDWNSALVDIGIDIGVDA